MDYLTVILSSLFSIAVLLAVTKIIGARQLSELSLFDYINGITIGSIAAEAATCDDFSETLKKIVAVVIYGIVTVVVSMVTDKSLTMRRFFNGAPLILMYEGKLNYGNFKKARLDIDEFMVRARNSGYFNLSDIHTAIFEANGKVSFLPMGNNKPVTPKDLKMNLPNDYPVHEIIVDGKIMNKTLEKIGKNEKWLRDEMKNKRIADIHDVFLATCDIKGETDFYLKG
ncbi:MAG: DUF421 domain-containing protein [Oscillospiraceae bacterium]|nr:DUF421 domain-containing protein [Oscillospiraceae bacterium]MDD6146299.1 DUF421 domain-containing protein [Oscillospiraceae bacterium]